MRNRHEQPYLDNDWAKVTHSIGKICMEPRSWPPNRTSFCQDRRAIYHDYNPVELEICLGGDWPEGVTTTAVWGPILTVVFLTFSLACAMPFTVPFSPALIWAISPLIAFAVS